MTAPHLQVIQTRIVLEPRCRLTGKDPVALPSKDRGPAASSISQISVCRRAVARRNAGLGAGSEAISGLGRAFFYAGTRALLVSSRPVETTSARASSIAHPLVHPKNLACLRTHEA